MLENCKTVKTFLMLLVILGHSCLFWTGEWMSSMKPIFSCSALGVFAVWLTSFHIYAFVLISGYIFYYVKYEKKNEKYWCVKKYIRNKFTRLIIPYIAISAIWVVPISLYVGAFNSSTNLISKFVLGKAPSQLWFLLMLFVVFMISYYFVDLWKRNSFFGFVVVIVFYSIGICGIKMNVNYFQFFSACTYMICFFIGFKIRQHFSFAQKLLRWPLLLWVAVDVLLFTMPLYGSDIFPQLFCKILQPFLLHVWGAVGAFFFLQKLLMICPSINRFFSSLSKYTMPIYLLHQQIIYVVIYNLNGLVNPYFNAIANFVISLTISTLGSVILMRFKLTRFLLGER